MQENFIDLNEMDKEKLETIRKSVFKMCETIKQDTMSYNTNDIDYLLSLSILSFDTEMNRKNDYFDVKKKCPLMPRKLIFALKRYINICENENAIPDIMRQTTLVNLVQIMYDNNLFYATDEALKWAHERNAEKESAARK